uniref:Uncharacterized protein n=1 Tax=Magnetococcus massalia (strain MO-1) TaxID=451514 RepID=A0A1S7LKQ8_MAGMO|nr:protein of unknown function [Candidatus Magnetococcus massalia]
MFYRESYSDCYIDHLMIFNRFYSYLSTAWILILCKNDDEPVYLPDNLFGTLLMLW